MSTLCAADICTPHCIHVQAESRIADILKELQISGYNHAAVYNGDCFAGAVSLKTPNLSNPQRIFADLVAQHSLPALPVSASIDSIGTTLQHDAPDGVAIIDENGAFAGIICKEDILNALLRETRNRLDEICRLKDQQESFRLLGKMASSMSHDLNNILTAIIGNLDLLNSTWPADEKEKKALAKTILTAALDAAGAVRRFQSYYLPARLKRGLAPVDLADIAREIMQFTRPKWHDEAIRNGKQITFYLDLQPTPFILGNGGSIREVLTNMVLNAVDAIELNGTITIRVHSRENHVVAEVVDTGTGMDEEQCTRCFEPFYTTKTDMDGTGLGLSISRDIIKESEGYIELDSSPGAGSTFRITFPAVQTDAAYTAKKQDIPLVQWRILLVDDEQEVRNVLIKMLEFLGQDVTSAASSNEALGIIEKQEYQLIICDQNLLNISGNELTRIVKTQRPATPVVIITGWSEASVTQHEHTNYNPDIILEKPVTLAMLKGMLIQLQSE